MNKLLITMLVGAIVSSLSACGGGSDTNSQTGENAAVAASSASAPSAASSDNANAPTASPTSPSSGPTVGTQTNSSQSNGTPPSNNTATPSATPPASIPTSTASSAAKLFYGMNGHINQSGIYQSIPVTTQLNFLKDLGITVYRNDGAEGTTGASKIAALADQAAPMGISILAILTPSFNANLNEDAAYQRSYAQGQAAGSTLKGHKVYYEAGNELEQFAKVSGDGSKAADYDLAKFNTYRGMIRGMVDGIRSTDPNAKIMVSQGVPLCYTALQMLWNGTGPDGSTGHPTVRWDITGYHWYESSGDIEKANAQDGTHPNVLQILKDSFGKPIWLTEFGATGGDTQAQQSSYVTSAYTEYYRDQAKYNIQNIMFFELLDGNDGAYGLMDNNQNKKTAYSTLKNFIAAHPDN